MPIFNYLVTDKLKNQLLLQFKIHLAPRVDRYLVITISMNALFEHTFWKLIKPVYFAPRPLGSHRKWFQWTSVAAPSRGCPFCGAPVLTAEMTACGGGRGRRRSAASGGTRSLGLTTRSWKLLLGNFLFCFIQRTYIICNLMMNVIKLLHAGFRPLSLGLIL